MATTLEIITIGGIDIIAQMFNAIATITKNNSFFNLMGIAEILGVVACVFSYIKTKDIQRMGIWLIFFVLINGLLLTPKVNLLVTDRTMPKVKKVDNVPVGVAVPFYLFSLSGNAIAQMYDTHLGQPNDVQYNRTGMLFGQRLLDRSFNETSRNTQFESNISNFTKSCIVPDIEINQKYTYQEFYNSANLFDFFLNNPKFKHSENRHMFYHNGINGGYVTCLDGSRKLKNDLNKITQERFSYKPKKDEKTLLDPRRASQDTMQGVYAFLMNNSKGATEIYKQNILVNSLRRNMDNLPASFDSSADMIAVASEQSLLRHRLANHASYQLATRTIPSLYTVFSTLLVGIFPIIILAMFVTEMTGAIIKSYLGFLFSLMLYPVLFAIFNSIVNTLTYQQLGGEAFTLSNADTLKANLSDIGGTAGYLMLSIPFISFGLIKGLGQAVTSAGSYLGNALSSTTSADASQVAMGNYNFGNMQMQNVNGFKTDLNSSFKAGMHTKQLANGAIENSMVDGSFSYNASASMSSLPFKVDWSKNISSSWNERSAMAIQEEARNSQGVRESISNALSRLSGFNSGNTHSTMRGKDWADNDGINKITNINDSSSSSHSDSISKDKSTGSNSSENTNVNASAGGKLFGNGASAEHNSTTGDNSSNSKNSSIRNNIELSLKRGEDFAKIDGYIESVKGSVSDSSFLTVLNNVQNDLREAREKYNDYVETESKSLNNAKEAILSNTQSVSVTQNLDSALYKHIKENYSESDQALILNAAPTREGVSLREKAISEVTGKYIDDIVDSHNGNVDNISDLYNKTNISNTAGEQPTDIRVSPNSGIDYSNESRIERLPVHADNNSAKKDRLNDEFNQKEKQANEEQEKIKRGNAVQRIAIDEKSKNHGVLAKEVEDIFK